MQLRGIARLCRLPVLQSRTRRGENTRSVSAMRALMRSAFTLGILTRRGGSYLAQELASQVPDLLRYRRPVVRRMHDAQLEARFTKGSESPCDFRLSHRTNKPHALILSAHSTQHAGSDPGSTAPNPRAAMPAAQLLHNARK